MKRLAWWMLVLVGCTNEDAVSDARRIAWEECSYLALCAEALGDDPPDCEAIDAAYEPVPDACLIYRPDDAAACISALSAAVDTLETTGGCTSYELPARDVCARALQTVEVDACTLPTVTDG